MTTTNSDLPKQQALQPVRGISRIWQWLVEPAASIQEIGARRQARLFSSLLVVLIPIVINGVVQTARLNQSGSSKMLLGLLPIVVLAYGLSRTRYYQLGMYLISIALSVSVFASFLLQDDYSNPIFLYQSLIWMVQALLLGSMLLSLWGTLMLTAANLLGLALLPVFIPEVPVSSLLVLCSFMVSISVLILVAYRHRDLLEKDRQFELTQRNRELQAVRTSLEQHVADLTQSQRVLETSEALGRRLATILNQKQLISTVVEHLRSTFNYYRVYIYLFDATGEYLVESTGAVGQGLPGQAHKIPRDQGLAGLAVKTKQVVLAPDVTQESAWLPNPLWPETKAEAAAPIIFGEQVLGVLDIQHNVSGGLQPEDADLFQAIANQLAVALRNTRRFAEAEAALTEARSVQERYIERAWEKGKAIQQGLKHRYALTNAPEPSETLLTATKIHALAQERAAIVSIDGSKTASKSIAAPVILGGKTIGVLQLHNMETEDSQLWSDEDLALVEAVLDQVAQTAESLRLFDETRERVDYERTVAEITQKLRQAPSLSILAKTAAEELGQVLGVSHSLVKLGPTSTEQQLSESGSSLQPQNGSG